ncbi:hypothetical protein RHO12_00380 [Orbus sturtevantii]|uniref:hypothetical protein n=1 Tax=Orbus sturtevantii TaxID=3074109 RepID=UPI00370DB880
MYHNFVPIKLHNNAEKLVANLTALSQKPVVCPYCQHNELYAVNTSSGYYRCKSCQRGFNRSLNTPFYRLAPLEWLPIIAERRLCGQSYITIRRELNCSKWVVKNRSEIIEKYMQLNFSDLYNWYKNFINEAIIDEPLIVQEQAKQLKDWFDNILQTSQAICPHCDSAKTQKIGEHRAQFRCKNCWRYFSNLKGTGLEHLSRSENWWTMIDLLVKGKTNRQIESVLGISLGTIINYKKQWLKIIQQRNLLVLKEWIINRRG